MLKPWPLISSEQIKDLGLFKLSHDRARSPRTDEERSFLVIHTPDWLQVTPVTTQGELVLVRQYRHASRSMSLEVPGGLLDAADPSPADAAARELKEETGYAGGEMHTLGSVWPQPAMLSNRAHFFAAVGVELIGGQEQDAGEDIEVVLVKPAELGGLMERGEIHNAMTVLALTMTRQKGLI